MSFLTRLLLVTLLSGPCIPQFYEKFIVLILKSIAAKQDSLQQKFDVLEDKLLAQSELLEDKLSADSEQLENLKLSVSKCSTKHQISTFHEFLTIDECETNTHNCSIYATCRDSPVDFECFCMAGYSGDGFICEDIDECKDDNNVCGDKEVCINLPGNFTCICQDGYEKQVDICQDVNECRQSHICSYQRCANLPGSYKCFRCTSPRLELQPFGCISFVEERMTWSDAQANCNANGGSLLHGFTRQQFITIRKHVNRYFFRGDVTWTPTWVGVQGGLFVKSPSDDVPPETSSSPDTDLWADRPILKLRLNKDVIEEEREPHGTVGNDTQCGYLYMYPYYDLMWDDDCSAYARHSLCQILY